MPILSGGLIVDPTVDEVADPVTVPWTEDYGTINATWIDPDGVEWPLSNDGQSSPWFTVDGPAGWGAGLVELVTDPLPRGGEQVRYVRRKPGRLQWPLYVGSDDSHLEFVQRYRQLVRAITKTSVRKAPGWLKIARGDGRYRTIACYYEEGLEGESRENHRFARPVVTFFCPDGYWLDDRPVSAYRQFTTETTGGGGGGTTTPATANFFSPFFNIASSKIVSGGGGDTGGGEGGSTGDLTTITNPGDAEAWPEWTIKGPMTYMVAENVTVGTRFGLRYALLDEQTITITTNRPSVRGPGNANLTGRIEWFDPAGCELWPMADGDNQVRFRIDGAGPGTRVDLNFTPRYETA